MESDGELVLVDRRQWRGWKWLERTIGLAEERRMLTITRKQPYIGEASGHVLKEEFAREFKRAGASIAALSTEQWEGLFGTASEGRIDGLAAILDPELPDDTILFYDSSRKLIGSLSNLYVVPKRKDDESSKGSPS